MKYALAIFGCTLIYTNLLTSVCGHGINGAAWGVVNLLGLLFLVASVVCHVIEIVYK